MNELNLIQEGSVVPGVVRQTMNLNASTVVNKDVINLQNSLFNGLRTIEFDLEISVNQTEDFNLLSRYNGGGVGRYGIAWQSGNRLKSLSNNGVSRFVNAVTSIPLNVKTTVAIRYDSVDGGRFFFNGVPDSANNTLSNFPIPTNTAMAYIGGLHELPFLGRYTRGKVSNVKLWSTSRTNAELLAGVGVYLNGTELGLVETFHFKDENGINTTGEKGNVAVISTSNTGGITHINNTVRVRVSTPNFTSAQKKIPLDLFEGEFVSVTKQSFNANNLTQRLSGITNDFLLPLTARNSQALDYLDVSGSKSNKPYELILCEYIQDGTLIIKKGRLNIKEINENGYKVSITHGINDFFDKIRDKQFYEPFVKRQNQIKSMFAAIQVLSNDFTVQNNEGVVIPLCNYNYINPIPEYQQTPFAIIKKAFEFIALDVDYNFIDSTNGRLDELLFGGGKLYQDEGELKEIHNNFNIQNGTSFTLGVFYTTMKGDIFREYDTTNTVLSGTPLIQIELFANGVLLNTYTVPNGVNDYNIWRTFPTIYEVGTKLEVVVSNNSVGSSSVNFTIGDVTLNQGSTFGVGGSARIFYENIFRGINQIEFISKVFELLNLGFEVDSINKTVKFYSLNEVYNPNIGSTIDLSNYFSNIIKTSFDSDFGKLNNFLYSYEDEKTRGLYNGSIIANNVNKEKDLINTDLVAPAFQTSINLGNAFPYIMNVDGYELDTTQAKSNEIGYRVVKQLRHVNNVNNLVSVLYKNRNLPSSNFTQTGTQTTVTFDGLDWTSLIEDNYSSLRDYVLNKFEGVTVLMRLPNYIIEEFSFQNKIYIQQLNSKFVVESIKTRPNGFSELKLIKLNQ